MIDLYIAAVIGLAIGIPIGLILRNGDDTRRLDFLAGTLSAVSFLPGKSLWGVIDEYQRVSCDATLRGAIDKAEANT